MISGGGTGGHIFPALSIANEIKRRTPDAEILFIGAENRMEMEKVPAAGYRIIGLPVSGFDRKNLLNNIGVAVKLTKSIYLANSILKKFKPHIVIGVGGYVSGPILKAAQKKKIPTLIQEQNSYAGITNKLLAKKASAICVAYEGMERFFPAEKIILTGNPVRKDLLSCSESKENARRVFGLDPDKKTVLIMGGSLGARTINECIYASVERIGGSDVQVIWQTGKIYDDTAKKVLKEKGTSNIFQTAFISNMDMAYKASDLVISRAGASSISELQILGKPSILVPSPNVAEDHQTKNAMALVDKNAAVSVKDADSGESLTDKMFEVIENDDLLNMLSANIRDMALVNADEKIADKIFEIINYDRR